MNRDGLITYVSMVLEKWPSVMAIKKHYDGWDWANGDHYPHLISHDKKFMITRDHWLEHRTELINCPPDSEAPEWAKWKAQDRDGVWYWCAKKPVASTSGLVTNESVEWAAKGKLPAGHRWQDTLTEVKHMEQPHEADARKLDAQLKADMRARMMADSYQGDMKQPRYQDVTGEDWIDEFARTKTVDEFRGAMSFNIGKYNRRVGKKDDVLKEVVKMRDYCQRWEAYERELLK